MENQSKDAHQLNSKILKITMIIKDKYPELSKFIEEMPETIPTEKNPEITQKNLQEYFVTLNSMLNKYLLEHPERDQECL